MPIACAAQDTHHIWLVTVQKARRAHASPARRIEGLEICRVGQPGISNAFKLVTFLQVSVTANQSG